MERRARNLAYLAAVGVLWPSCGGGGGAPTGPSVPAGDPALTISINVVGTSPKQLTVPQGTRVRFTNNDSQIHEMDSDPHPDHTDCVEINNIGFISPGQTKETGNLNTIRTCGYHDHGNPDDARFRGQIIIRQP
jgi:plastocyanin